MILRLNWFRLQMNLGMCEMLRPQGIKLIAEFVPGSCHFCNEPVTRGDCEIRWHMVGDPPQAEAVAFCHACASLLVEAERISI
jgi:hypothetical protein